MAPRRSHFILYRVLCSSVNNKDKKELLWFRVNYLYFHKKCLQRNNHFSLRRGYEYKLENFTLWFPVMASLTLGLEEGKPYYVNR